MNIFSLKEMEPKEVLNILDLAKEFEEGKTVDYKGQKIVANLFFEPSTRTHYSFDTAELRLGCRTMNFDSSNSSLKKGESFYDTIKTFESFGVDALVIRHKVDEYYKKLENKIHIPIINGGDGAGSHPSQSLLDLYTIRKQFGKLEGLGIIIVGDIRHSRVAHTNINIMQRLGMKVYISGPKEYREDRYEFRELEDVIDKIDIVMLLRVQHERHENNMSIGIDEYRKRYSMFEKRVNQMKENAIIMHPAPFNRGVEILDEVVECERSKIFEQVKNGVYIRMALLHMVLGQE